ncbi:MAG TPA: RDD family protein [Candidatus Polarisedimenticolia bacterium]|nr:RDD family protein [Candidatus Polarisedimenticolia bacterium]
MARRPMVYAGFWLRAAAYLLDTIVLSFPVGVFILGPLMERAGISPDNPWVLFTGTSRQVIAINLLGTMASWLYWALLESSRWQATLGKRMLGLEVTDLAGHRISFARATGRYFGKAVSALLLFVGFAMAGFTEKKQALHDMFASCLVLKKT